MTPSYPGSHFMQPPICQEARRDGGGVKLETVVIDCFNVISGEGCYKWCWGEPHPRKGQGQASPPGLEGFPRVDLGWRTGHGVWALERTLIIG